MSTDQERIAKLEQNAKDHEKHCEERYEGIIFRIRRLEAFLVTTLGTAVLTLLAVVIDLLLG